MDIYEQLADETIKQQLEDIKQTYNPQTQEQSDLIKQGLEVYRALYVQFSREECTKQEAKTLYKLITQHEDLIRKAAKVNQRILQAIGKLV